MRAACIHFPPRWRPSLTVSTTQLFLWKSGWIQFPLPQDMTSSYTPSPAPPSLPPSIDCNISPFFCLLSSFLWFLSLSLVYCCLPLNFTSSFSVPLFPFFFFLLPVNPPYPPPLFTPPLLSLEFFCFSCHQLSFFLFSCLSKETSWENKKQHELKSIECIRIFRHVCLTAFCPDIQDVKVWKPQVAG